MGGLVLRAGDADGLTGPLAGTCISLGALTADRKSTAMAQATVAVDCLEALQVTLNLSAEITLDDNLLAGDGGDDRSDLLGREFLGADVGIDVGLL